MKILTTSSAVRQMDHVGDGPGGPEPLFFPCKAETVLLVVRTGNAVCDRPDPVSAILGILKLATVSEAET